MPDWKAYRRIGRDNIHVDDGFMAGDKGVVRIRREPAEKNCDRDENMKTLRNTAMLIGVTMAMAATPLAAQSQLNQTSRLPNIVFILADDMGIDSVSALNARCGIETPHIDRLIRQGMHFTDAHSGSAVCSPTRYGVLTGRYSWRSTMKRGIVGRYKPPLIGGDRLTVGGMLQDSGYHTACIGKWHLGWNWFDKNGKPTTNAKTVDYSKATSGGPVDRGFHYYFGDDVPNWPPYVYFENHKTLGIPSVPKPKETFGSPGLMMPDWSLEAVLPEITRRSVKYINERAKKNQPFFLYFPLTSPHTPIAPAEEFKGKSGISAYADFVMETDWCVGEIMRALSENGIEKDTLLFFTADNGTSPQCNFGELESKGVQLRYNYRGYKADIYEGGHRVPFTVRWPGVIPADSYSDQTICLTDFMATVADVIGYELPPNAAEDSLSLMPILKGDDSEKALHEAVINHSISGHFAVRKGKWKLAFSQGSGGWSEPKESAAKKQSLPKLQLFDLKADPKEQNNLHETHPEIVKDLSAILKRLVQEGRSTPGPAQSNEGGPWWSRLPWPAPNK